ncbi:MAG: InlB B-repeat-containing protein [Treponema sp.]
MKLKRMFSLVGTLAMLMSVVFLISGCKSQSQRGQGAFEQVTITYSTEHGTAPASKQVDKNYKLTAGDLPSLSATGFVFEGWYIEGTKATVGYVVTKSITLSAKWKDKITISYSTEHGTAPASKQVDKNYKLTAGDLPSLSATGFVFEGWYIEGTKATVGYVVTKSITLSAKWKDKITISYSTEHGVAPASKTVDEGYTLTQEDLPPISVANFTFEGWYIEGTKVNVGYTVNKNITLIAKWTIVSGKAMITYSTEHGMAPQPKVVDEGYQLKAEDLAPISADGFKFEGWYVEGVKATVGYTVSKITTLVAKWMVLKKVTITYSTEHGTAPASKTVFEGYTLTYEDLPDISATGFRFEGWYWNNTRMSIGDVINEDMALTAKWIVIPKKITITYQTAHGTAPQPKIVDEGHRLTEGDLNPISAKGFIFEAWYVDGQKAVVGRYVANDITLTATWQTASGEKVTITYSTDKDTAPASKTVDKGYKLTKDDLPPLSADGFIFNGWHVGETKANLGYAVNESITLTAKWAELQYVSFTTSRSIGKTVSLGIDAKPEDRPYVWIDLNNNGIREDGENIGSFGYHSGGHLDYTYFIANQTLRVYGKITHLRCCRNDITSINFKNCEALKEIMCVEPTLTSFDLSGCTALKVLACGNLKLSTLNLKDFKTLQRLWCRYNNITSLDVSGCIALETLYCERSKLTNLNVKGCIALKELHCAKNKLTSLDVSDCKALETLQCYHNQIPNLDLSGHKALKVATIMGSETKSVNLKGCIALEQFSCIGNKLKALDVSECKALEILHCNYNQITSLDISECKTLKTLHCYYNQLTSFDVSQNKELVILLVYKNKIQGANMDALIASLPTVSPTAKLINPRVETLTITPFDLNSGINSELLGYSGTVQGGNMDAVIESFHALSPSAGNTNGIFVIVNNDGEAVEDNKYTRQNISDANAKNWKVYDLNGSKKDAPVIEL